MPPVAPRRLALAAPRGVGLDGALLRSSDGGRSFKAMQREDRLALTAVVAVPGGALRLFSEQGVVAP